MKKEVFVRDERPRGRNFSGGQHFPKGKGHPGISLEPLGSAGMKGSCFLISFWSCLGVRMEELKEQEGGAAPW